MKYLREIHFENCKKVNPFSLSHPQYAQQRKEINAVVYSLFRATGLYEYFQTALRKEKYEFGENSIQHLWIELTGKEVCDPPDLYIGGGVATLGVELAYDPYDLLDVPRENAVLGELFISFVEQALERLIDYPQVPFDLIRDTLAEYRANNYTYHFELGERMLPGTKVKGRIDVALSCSEIRRTLTLSYRGKHLSTTDIGGEQEIPVNFYRFFSKFHMDGDILQIDRISPTGEHSFVDLSQYPGVMEYVSKTRG